MLDTPQKLESVQHPSDRGRLPGRSGANDRRVGREMAAHYGALRRGGVGIMRVPDRRCPAYRVCEGYVGMRSAWPYGLEIPYSRGELARRDSRRYALYMVYLLVRIVGVESVDRRGTP